MDHDRTEKDLSSLTTADVARAGGQPRETATASESDRPFAGQRDDGSSRGGKCISTPVFSPSEAGDLRTRWESIQVGFVDEPRGSVERADMLVAEAISHLAEGFASQREELEHHWVKGDDVSTEELRLSLRRYRSFFERLLTI